MKRRRLKAEPGQTILGLRRSCSAGETSHWEGEIKAIVITNDPIIERGPIPINILTKPSPLKPSSSLVSGHCLKTSYWYLWVSSSVDYSL